VLKVTLKSYPTYAIFGVKKQTKDGQFHFFYVAVTISIIFFCEMS